MATPCIAIVGGGFSGCMTAVHLLRQARSALRIILIEREDMPGRGVAYRNQPECHLLNVRAEGMSAFPDRPDHFLDWLNSQYSPCHPVGTGEFLPRRLYGSYLESLLTQAQADARRGVRLDIRSDEVLGLARKNDRYVLKLRSGTRMHAQQVVLALGNPGPADLSPGDTDFHRHPRYLSQAGSTPDLYALGRDENLLLIGSGLTALDWLASLRERGHRGRIHVVSRRGLLPQLHKAAPTVPLSFDPLQLEARVRPVLRRLRAEIRRVETAGGDWRSVIDALRPHTQALWQRLPENERRRFLRHVRPYWEIHRHRAAPRIADAVYELLRSGQLQIRAARLLAYAADEQGVSVSLRPRYGEAALRLQVHRVINCTGPDSNYRRLHQPLIVNLRELGWLQADALGLGLLTDEHGTLIDTTGQTMPGLYTLGPPRKGQLWETTAAPEIRVQAQALARRLLDTSANLTPPPPTTRTPARTSGDAKLRAEPL